MKTPNVSALLLGALLSSSLGVDAYQYRRGIEEENFAFKPGSKHLRPVVEKRQANDDVEGYLQGQPNNYMGKGGRFAGGTNRALDLQNPSNLGKVRSSIPDIS